MSLVHFSTTRKSLLNAALAILTPALFALDSGAQQSVPKESPAVRLLKSGKIPPERLGTVIAIVGRQGTPADFAVILQKAAEPHAFPRDVRLKALETLADAAANRKVFPESNRDSILTFLPGTGGQGDAELARAALRNIVAWRLTSAVERLTDIARSEEYPADIRSECMKSIAQIGGTAEKENLKKLAESAAPQRTRVMALAAISSVDPEMAAPITAKLWTSETVQKAEDIREVLNGFLSRTNGPEVLAKAIGSAKLTEDTAKLALRQLYAIGRSDSALVTVLSSAAGIASDLAPPTDVEIKALIKEVAEKGDPARGELVFRSDSNSCMKCHALRGAGGQVGPELSDVGGVSPVDFLINSVMVPEAAVKEQYQMLTALTADGRIVQGIIVDQDDQSVKLKDAEGREFSLNNAEIEDKKTGGSLMPQGLPKLMTRQEFVDLIRFLSELGKPGPYQRTAAATVQKWRVLTTPPSELSTPAPDNQVIQAVLNAPDSAWSTAYAFFDGTLPLETIRPMIGSKEVIFLQGEIEVNGRGQTRLDVGDPKGITAWLNDQPIRLREGNPPSQSQARTAVADRIAAQAKQAPGQFLLPIGRHKITIRMDLRENPRDRFRAEFAPVEFGQAILTVIGGK